MSLTSDLSQLRSEAGNSRSEVIVSVLDESS